MVVDLIHFAGILQALLLAFYFFSSYHIRGNIHYGLFLVNLGGTIFIGYLYSSGKILEFPALARTGFPLTGLSGPFLYLGIRGQYTQRFQQQLFSRNDWIYFLLPVAILIYLTPFYLSPVSLKLDYLQDDLHSIHLDCYLINILTVSYSFLFTFLAFLLLRKVRWLKMGDQKQQREIFRQQAYLGLLAGVLLVWSIVTVIDSNSLNTGKVSILGGIVIFVISLDRIYYNRSGPGQKDIPAPLYQKSLLSDQRTGEISQNLDTLLTVEKLYLDPDIRLEQLASKLGVSRNHLSQAINRSFHCKFPDLLNQYRLEESKRLLSDRKFDDYTILRIALESGFNSKSTFNASFKKYTGMNPSEYKESIRKEL